MIYLDTSVLIAAHIPEVNSERALTWLEANAEQAKSIGGWTITEFASALSRKVRTDKLTREERERARNAFASISADAFTMFDVHPEDFYAAASMVERDESGLRASDALHLAVAVRIGARLGTFDVRMGEAAALFEIATEPL
jgi:predicted nucleic acid-binding protein